MNAPAGIDRRGLSALAAGHACSDMTQGALPALLPFLIARHGFSYGQAGALVLAAGVGSSVVQPLFGVYADRLSSPWLLPAGVAVGGFGIALVGVAGSFPLTLAVLVLGGLGVAAFHPEGARFAGFVSGDRRAAGMSYFAVGGNAGFALGPVLVAPLVLAFGLRGTLLLALPTTLVALLLARELPALGKHHPALLAGAEAEARGRPEWRPFTRLVVAAVLRTGAFFGLQAFVPIYLVAHLGASKATAAAALTVMLVSGAVGTLVGGRFADRIGRRNLLAGSMVLLLPLLVLLPSASLPVAFALLVGVGLTLDAPFSTTLVFGQELVRGREGLASGITLGLAVGLGGLIAAGLGSLADATSLTTALYVIAALPIPALALALTLPRAARLPAHV